MEASTRHTQQQQAERKTPANMLQAIRTRFTAGRPRKVPLEMLGPMYATMLANLERDKIRDFITEQGSDAAEFVVQVFIVTAFRGGPDTDRGRTWVIPEGLEKIVALADKLKKIEGTMYAGMLVTVHDRKRSAVVRYLRPFIPSPEANEILALAALQQRFGKAGA